MSQQLACQGQHLLTSVSWTKGYVQSMKSTRAGARSGPRALRPHSLGFPTLPSVVTLGRSPLGSADKTLPHIDLSGCRVQLEGNVGASSTLFGKDQWLGREGTPQPRLAGSQKFTPAAATVEAGPGQHSSRAPLSLPQLLLCPPRTRALHSSQGGHSSAVNRISHR